MTIQLENLLTVPDSKRKGEPPLIPFKLILLQVSCLKVDDCSLPRSPTIFGHDWRVGGRWCCEARPATGFPWTEAEVKGSSPAIFLELICFIFLLNLCSPAMEGETKCRAMLQHKLLEWSYPTVRHCLTSSVAVAVEARVSPWSNRGTPKPGFEWTDPAHPLKIKKYILNRNVATYKWIHFGFFESVLEVHFLGNKVQPLRFHSLMEGNAASVVLEQ